jgi:hypothetical protein
LTSVRWSQAKIAKADVNKSGRQTAAFQAKNAQNASRLLFALITPWHCAVFCEPLARDQRTLVCYSAQADACASREGFYTRRQQAFWAFFAQNGLPSVFLHTNIKPVVFTSSSS